jgi:drug/metabolite transporter (DMT)-like permease
VVLSAAVLAERPSAWQLLGAAIVLVGVVAATAGRRATRAAPDVVPAPLSATIEA